MTQISISGEAAHSATQRKSLSQVLPALAAGLFGLFIVWGVGLSNSDAMHNAAHDTRHSFAFPCH